MKMVMLLTRVIIKNSKNVIQLVNLTAYILPGSFFMETPNHYSTLVSPMGNISARINIWLSLEEVIPVTTASVHPSATGQSLSPISNSMHNLFQSEHQTTSGHNGLVSTVPYGHSKVKPHFGRDPREYCVMSARFVGDDNQQVLGISTTRAKWKKRPSGD